MSHCIRTLCTLALLAAIALPVSAAPAASLAGAEVRTDADATDVGLPLFPGAQPVAPHDGGDSAAVNLSIWGGQMGFRLAVIKLQSDAPIAAIADFYRRALTRRGPMRDCAQPAQGEGPSCDKGAPPPGGFLFKAGIDDEEIRTVSLKPQDGGVLIQLVRVAFGRDAAVR